MQYLFLLLAELILLPLINSDDSPFPSGFYTDGLDQVADQVEIVYPEKVSKDGSTVSHYLPHFYDMDSVDHRQRRRSGHIRDRRDDTVHFYVPIDGERNHLELWPNADFISPGLVIERRDARDVGNVNKAKISQISSKQCHYNGRIVDKPESSVALSTCYGLTGYIRVPHGEEYLIEPVKDFQPGPNKEHPHIIYKRSGTREKHGPSNCLTKGRAKEALEERAMWEALYGDQVQRELSSVNINDVVREFSERQKLLQPEEFSLRGNSKHVDKTPIRTDSRSNMDNVNSNTLHNKLDYNFQGVPQNDMLEKEIRNNIYYFGDKQKSTIEEKPMEGMKLPENSLKPISPEMDNSLLYEMSNRLKGQGENDRHVFKRDLNMEENEYTKLSNDEKQNAYSYGKSGITACGKSAYGDGKTWNKKEKLENTVKSRREAISNSLETETLKEESETPVKTVNNNNEATKNKTKQEITINKSEQRAINQKDQSNNNQSDPKDKDSQFNCGAATNMNIKKEPTLSNEINDQLIDAVKDNKKRDVHLDRSDKSWQINEDNSKESLELGRKQDKRSDLPSEQSSQIENIDRVQQKSSDKDLNKQKVKKEIPVNLSSFAFDGNRQQKKSNPTINNPDNSLLENVCQTNNKVMDNCKAKIPETSDTNERVVLLNKGADSVLNPRGHSETAKHQVNIKQNLAEDIVIRIKVPEGSDITSVENQVPSTNTNEQYKHLEKGPEQSSADNENKRGINDDDSNNVEKELSIDKDCVKDMREFESKSYNDGEINKQSQHKSKRNDNTINLKIDAEPEINNAEVNMNSRAGLFCHGNDCLEIKPIHLNESNSDTPSLNNNTNKVNAKTKIIEKRQAWTGDCDQTTTTEKPLLCFDLFSKLFNLELMIVVDSKVLKMHEDDDIENFILTIINMVSTNFFDRSLGINLSVVLVRLIVLTTCIKELDSDRFNPEELLENFCTWQVLINPGKDDHPHHHDLAIFVTRMDKCEGKIMGVTYMTSVCRPDKACLVCVDEGLLLANTITHQIGHSLGAEHDDGQSSGCTSSSQDGSGYHMSPVISETSSAWSVCSKDAIIQFVKTQGSWCLRDLPIERNFNFPLMLPGQIYSAPQQCKLNFHMTAIPCSVGSFCEKLYCQVTEKLCATKGDPPADGTFCAADMWCFHKQCVHIGRRPGSVNGEWGPWTEWSVCTRSCGGGVSTSYRMCDNPKPENGGRFCIGERIRHKMCATKPCQGSTESFRDLQCKRTEDRPFRGRFHNWLQYTSHFLNIECSLVCQNRKGDVVMRSPIVADGTPCKAGTRNVCIQGTCRNVGCDWVIDSKAKEDACGICHGNSTECRIIQGVFDEPTQHKGLIEFLRIPKNSGMIFVREINPSRNVIVVSGAISKVYYLNGIGSEDSMPGDVTFGATHGVYEVRSLMERIFIRGPTTEDLIFYVLFREPNTGIQFQYAVPEMDPTYVPRYLWQYLDWDPCTDPCSGGSQRAHAKCVEDRGGVVDDEYCTETTRPIDVIRPCNEFPCQAKWWVSVWSECICTVSSSVMFRSVLCMRSRDESATRLEIVKESECALYPKPPTQKECNATEFDNECFKRSIHDNLTLGSHKYIRRAINPNTAYNSYYPDESFNLNNDEKEMTEGKEKSGSTKNQRKPIKLQSTKSSVKDDANKLKSKSPDKETNFNFVKDKNDEANLVKNKGYKESKYGAKVDDLPVGSDKGKQLAKLNLRNGPSLRGGVNTMKHANKAKQSEEGVETNIEHDEKHEEKCSTTSAAPEECPTQEEETTEPSTCKSTNAVQMHKKTTCCKTTPRRKVNTRTMETTTLRPVIAKIDDVNLDNFQLQLVPLDLPNKKKLLQTDSEFINLGNIGQFGVGDERNGTVITGQEAIDFLDFARNNASEEPIILHEDMPN